MADSSLADSLRDRTLVLAGEAGTVPEIRRRPAWQP